AYKNFDVKLSFQTSADPGRLDDSTVAIFEISLAGLVASDFDFVNSASGAAHVAAHVQGIPGSTGTTSGAIKDGSVPDGGATLTLLGLGLVGVAGLRRVTK